MIAKSGNKSIAKCQGILDANVLIEFVTRRVTSPPVLIVSVSMVVRAPPTELNT